MARKTTLVLGLLVASIAFAAVVGATTAVTGTVTVENGTADGANVTITPLTENFTQLDDPVRTTVEGNQFSAEIRDAPMYRVEVVHGGAIHSAVLRIETVVSMTLNRSLSGRVTNEAGEPQDATIELVGPAGYSVDRTRTGSNGTFSFGPLKPNATYRVKATVDGVPYVRTVETDGNASVTVETVPPTDDESVLEVAGGNIASHVLQVIAPPNASQSPSVVETVIIRNTADRPYVGQVTLRVPEGATPYSAMFQGSQADYRETPRGVAVNVTVPSNATSRVGLAYDLQGQAVRKQFGHDVDSIGVVFRGYQPQNVNHSSNLEVGDAPISLLTNTEPIAKNDTIRLDLPASSGSTSSSSTSSSSSSNSQQASAESNSMPAFPAIPLFGGLVAIVIVGFVAYRVV